MKVPRQRELWEEEGRVWGRNACEVWGFVQRPDEGLENCRRGQEPAECMTLGDGAPGAVLSKTLMLEGVQGPPGALD